MAPDLIGLGMSAGMMICAAMTIVWVIRARAKGAQAYVMASAFVVLGLLMYMVKENIPMWAQWTAAGVLAVLLGIDVVFRALQEHEERTKKK